MKAKLHLALTAVGLVACLMAVEANQISTEIILGVIGLVVAMVGTEGVRREELNGNE